MNVVWSPEARQQLFAIVDYIFQDSPQNALSVQDRLEQFPELLTANPYLGREGRELGTRELLHGQLPFFFVYEVHGDEVHILEVRHYKQEYP